MYFMTLNTKARFQTSQNHIEENLSSVVQEERHSILVLVWCVKRDRLVLWERAGTFNS